MDNPGRSLLLIGGVGLVIGALLPWATLSTIFGSVSIAGTEGDGILTAGLGLIVFVFAVVVRAAGERRYAWVGIIAGALALLISLPKYGSFNEITFGDEYGFASRGVGFYTSVLSGILTVVGGFIREPNTQPIDKDA